MSLKYVMSGLLLQAYRKITETVVRASVQLHAPVSTNLVQLILND